MIIYFNFFVKKIIKHNVIGKCLLKKEFIIHNLERPKTWKGKVKTFWFMTSTG